MKHIHSNKSNILNVTLSLSTLGRGGGPAARADQDPAEDALPADECPRQCVHPQQRRPVLLQPPRKISSILTLIFS